MIGRIYATDDEMCQKGWFTGLALNVYRQHQFEGDTTTILITGPNEKRGLATAGKVNLQLLSESLQVGQE